MVAVTPFSRRPLATCLLVAAAILGTVHGAWSIYWGLGGDVLLPTVGQTLIAAFATVRWLLIPVGVGKVLCAVLPLLVLRWRRARVLWRLICVSRACILIAWGLTNTVSAQLILAGVIHTAGPMDRMGTIGHAWLWDPLFFLWGVTLLIGTTLFIRSTGGRAEGRPQAANEHSPH